MEQKEVIIGFWGDLPSQFTNQDILSKIIYTQFEIFKLSLKKNTFTYELKPKIILSSVCDKKFNGLVTTALKNDFSFISYFREPDEKLDKFCELCDNFYIYTNQSSPVMKTYISKHFQTPGITSNNSNFTGVINFIDINSDLNKQYNKIAKTLIGLQTIN